MGIEYSPSTVRSDLAFYYDMGNTQKSFRGPPTTNLTPDMSIQAIQGAPTVSFVGIEDGWKKYSLNGTWTAGTYPYSIGVQAPTFTGGVTYSTGVYIKTNVPQKFASLFTGMNYVNEPMNNGGTSFSITQPDGSIYVGRSGFQYTNTTAQTGYLLSQPIIGQTFNGATDFVFIRQGQIEIGAFPTPFVAGTRSNTQSILDLTNNNTVTANSLTYDANGTFNFNGSTNFISTNFVGNTPSFTYEVFLRPTNVSKDQMYIGYSPISAHYVRIVNSRAYVSVNTTVSQQIFHDPRTLANNTNYHIVSCYNGIQLKIYVNGELSAGPVLNQRLAGWGIDRIGRWLDSDQRAFVGTIFNLKTYNRELSALEVQQNFNALRGRFGI